MKNVIASGAKQKKAVPTIGTAYNLRLIAFNGTEGYIISMLRILLFYPYAPFVL